MLRTPQTHSHSMYAPRESDIERDKDGNWTGPSASGDGASAKDRGKLRAVRSKKQMREN